MSRLIGKIISSTLQYISDIHLEYRTTIPRIPVNSRFLALAGDIGYHTQSIYSDFIKYTSDNWEKVFLVAGNHCYYNDPRKGIYNINEVNDRIRNICDKHPNVYFLQKNSHTINDDYIIMGATLWTNIIHDKYFNKRGYLIYMNGKPAVKSDIDLLHTDHKNWIQNECSRFNHKKIIVLTHHLPSFKLIHPTFVTNNYAHIHDWFATDLEHLITPPVKYWICGHSHRNMNVMINNIPVLINPLGYNSEKTGVNFLQVVEL